MLRRTAVQWIQFEQSSKLTENTVYSNDCIGSMMIHVDKTCGHCITKLNDKLNHISIVVLDLFLSKTCLSYGHLGTEINSSPSRLLSVHTDGS